MTMRALLRACLLAPLCTIAPAQDLAVGAPAPAIEAASWLNWDGDAPTLQSLAGRVVMIEFWGTWCGPCVRAMPGVQKLHDRYRDRGLTVLAISYEPVATLQPFLQKNAFSMPVGSDPDKKTIGAYPVHGWPTTIVIDKAGKIAHIGSPYDAEAAVEKALGLEAGPAALLDHYLDRQGAAEARAALERLAEKATHDFDLQAWAKGHLPPDTVAGEGGAAAPAAKPLAKPVEGAAVLGRCAKAWSDQVQRTALLQQLADAGPATFDLAAFAQQLFAKAYPFDANELKAMLKEKKYAGVVDAIATRAPAAAVIAAASKDGDLIAFCKGQADTAHTMAKKGLMAQLWVFPGALPKDEQVNSKFFGELSVSGFATSPDQKSIVGITLGGEMVMREQIQGFVDGHLNRALVMNGLGSGKAPNPRELDKLRDKARQAITTELERRYGKPEPRTK